MDKGGKEKERKQNDHKGKGGELRGKGGKNKAV